MITEQIRLILEQKSLTQQELADILSVPLNRVKNLANGRVKKLHQIEIATLHKRLNVNLSWLTAGEGEPFLDDFAARLISVNSASQRTAELGGSEQTKRLKQEFLTALYDGDEDRLEESFDRLNFMLEAYEDTTWVPLVRARLSAGNGSLETEDRVEARYAFRRDWISQKGRVDKMVLMRVVGDSMEPDLCNGDMVLLDQSQNEIVAGAFFAVGIEDAVVVKALDQAPGKLILRSVNPAYPPMDVPMTGDLADTVRIIGRVIWWCREA